MRSPNPRDRSPSHYGNPHYQQLAIDYPGGLNSALPYGYPGSYHTEHRSRKLAPGKGGNNYFGTWSGSAFNPQLGVGKKEKKNKRWFSFATNKNTLKKSKSGKLNTSSEYDSSTMPLTKTRSSSTGNLYTSSSLKRRSGSEVGLDRGGDWSTDPSWGQDEPDSGIHGL